MADLICLACIGAPHGVRGEVRVKSFSDDPLSLAGYGPLVRSDGGTPLVIETLRMQGEMLVVRFSGIVDRDGAAALGGVSLLVARDQLPDMEPDVFYHADLIGLPVYDGAGACIGSVTALYDFGAGDVIEIARTGEEPLVLPFEMRFVPVVDVAGRRVEVIYPEEEA